MYVIDFMTNKEFMLTQHILRSSTLGVIQAKNSIIFTMKLDDE